MFSRLLPRIDGITKYQRINSDDEDVKVYMLDDQSEPSLDTETRHRCAIAKAPSRYQHSGTIFLVLINILMFSISCGIMALHLRLAGSHKYHLKAISNHSPVFDALNMRLESRVFNGTLFPVDDSQIFRQDPSPEVDAAWEEISSSPVFLVDRQDIEKIGKDPRLVVKAPSSWNVGEKYLALLDGHHQMHCLNEIRKQAYAYYYYGPQGSRHPLHWVHFTHCLDIIRQSIMCSASVDLITSNWVETQPGAYPDFNVAHQCRDYEATLRWAHEQGDGILTEERRSDLFQPPEDAIVLPMEAEFYKYAPALVEYHHTHPDFSPSGHSHVQ